MKTLLVMRHAKSVRDDQGRDHDRPLNLRGLEDAPKMGRFLKDNQLAPDYILASSAVRALQTAKGVLDGLVTNDLAIQVDPDLYLCDVSTYFASLSRLPDDRQRGLVISHNPGTAAFIFALTGRFIEVTTANIGIVELDINHWNELAGKPTGKLINFFRPKELPESGLT
ncbi:MAG: histidine phosphatase family protein [Chloroflexota bacterium]